MHSITEIVVSGTLGVVAGTLAGLLGVGGGAIIAPLLALLLGFEPHRAQGISLAALLPPVGLPALVAYRRSGVRVEVRIVLLLLVGFLGGVTGGAWLAHRVSGGTLRALFAVFLVVSAWRALRGARREAEGARVQSKVATWIVVAIGTLAGVLSGLLGVGGGLVALPLLRKYAGLSRLEAQATTLAMMLPPIGLPAVWVYATEQGGLPWILLIAVGAGFAFGAGWGGRFAERLTPRTAGRLYGGLLLAVAVTLVHRP